MALKNSCDRFFHPTGVCLSPVGTKCVSPADKEIVDSRSLFTLFHLTCHKNVPLVLNYFRRKSMTCSASREFMFRCGSWWCCDWTYIERSWGSNPISRFFVQNLLVVSIKRKTDGENNIRLNRSSFNFGFL